MPEHPALSHSLQLLLVVSRDWDAPAGTLYRFDRPKPGEQWHLIETVPVSLGKNGLAWGVGLHGAAPTTGPIKHEGDGKSPAGIFALGPAFGYAPPAQNATHDFPYLQITEHTFGIEDPASAHYNTIVDSTQIPAPDWKGADHMLRPDNLYQHGVMVQHNPHPGAGQQPPLGSCIFLHLWRGPGQPTVGCTAMSAEKISALTAWLRQDAQPRLVQLTKADYHRLRPGWGLPRIPEPVSLTFTLLGILALLAIVSASLRLRRARTRS